MVEVKEDNADGRSIAKESTFNGSADENCSEKSLVGKYDEQKRDELDKNTKVETWQKVGLLAQYLDLLYIVCGTVY